MNRDGLPDILAQMTSNLAYFVNLGNGFFSNTAVTVTCNAPCSNPTGLDLQNDGFPDISIKSGTAVHLLRGFLSAGFLTFTRFVLFTPVTPVDYFFVDLDNDGIKEFVFCGAPFAGSGYASVGILSSPAWVLTVALNIGPLGGLANVIRPLDYNGDQLIDLMCFNTVGQMTIFRNLGNLRFIPVESNLHLGRAPIFSTDFDGR